jgi:hypothetical protein
VDIAGLATSLCIKYGGHSDNSPREVVEEVREDKLEL